MIDPMIQKTDLYDILIVDDSQTSLELLNCILEERGYRVRQATNGLQALKSVAAKRPDLILLDIMMPGMDGHEVFSRLKTDEDTQNIPVIFLTAKSDEQDQVKGLELGAQDYITKPFSSSVVLARIKSTLTLKKEMEKHLLLETQMQQLNYQLEQQVQKKAKELQKAQQKIESYELKYSYLHQKEASQERPQTLLLVDDNQDNIHILMDYLEDDYEIVFATSGERAIEIASSKDRPDLILLDIVMPNMDGYEVCSRLKASANTRGIPVIFVTALGQEVDEAKGLGIGAVDFITKPFSMPIARARVQAALRLKQEMDNRILLTEKLTDTNQALKALLDQREIEKKSIEQVMVVNLKRFVYPYLDQLDRVKIGDDVKSFVNIIRTNIEQLISPVSKHLSSVYLELTPTQIKVADLIRQGQSTKSIAEKLNTSPSTVEKHRNMIRKKLNILNKKVNLTTYLNSLS